VRSPMKARMDVRVGGARLLPSIKVRVHTYACTGRVVSRLVPPDAARPPHLAPTSSNWSSLVTTNRSKTGSVVTRDKTVVTIRRLAPISRGKTKRDQSEQDETRRAAPTAHVCVTCIFRQTFSANTQSGRPISCELPAELK